MRCRVGQGSGSGAGVLLESRRHGVQIGRGFVPRHKAQRPLTPLAHHCVQGWSDWKCDVIQAVPRTPDSQSSRGMGGLVQSVRWLGSGSEQARGAALGV